MEATPRVIDLTLELGRYEDDALALLKIIRPRWNCKDIKFERFCGGSSNCLFLCTSSSSPPSDGVVVRIYGDNTQLFTDRDTEVAFMRLMNARRGGAPVYARFQNGLACGFIEGVCFDNRMIREPYLGSLVAKEMAHIHSIGIDDIHRYGISTQQGPLLFVKMRHFLGLMPEGIQDPALDRRFRSELPSIAELRQEIDMLENHVASLGCPVALCHNDTLQKNIVYNKDQDRVYFIDYEFGFMNYVAVDIGEHFCYWAVIGDAIDYSLYPSREEQLPWLRIYLQHMAVLAGRSADDVIDNVVERYYVLTNKFVLCAHILWGLWGAIQVKYHDSAIDFDYLGFAKARFDEYYAKRDQFLSLRLPSLHSVDS